MIILSKQVTMGLHRTDQREICEYLVLKDSREDAPVQGIHYCGRSNLKAIYKKKTLESFMR